MDRRWKWAVAVLAGAAILVLVLVGGPWLLTRHPSHGLAAEQQLKARNDVRATLVQVLAGFAVGGGLVVTYRTFRQNQRDQRDATYARAVEQLGHERAPVRLGAMYSLTSLAQGDRERRQTVVDVLCAYLRMPVPAPEQGGDKPEPVSGSAEEAQVRATAQRILFDHLRPSAGERFWRDIDLNLTGAALVDADLQRIEVRSANFAGAVFRGGTRLKGARFAAQARFDRARFTDSASFLGTIFHGEALFSRTVFDRASFFDEAVFDGTAWFTAASFAGEAWFRRTRFRSVVVERATFGAQVHFDRVRFGGSADLRRCTFSNPVTFHAVEGGDTLTLDGATASTASASRSTWPPGWTLAEPANGDVGTLVRTA
jgi:uncharacterized protein YjbI with pentapeptide repeats